MKKKIIILILTLLTANSNAQFIPEHISNKAIYSFLDELAGSRIIQLNSAVKPYSKEMITSKLSEAKLQKEKLTPRQQKELDFYLRAYRLENKSDTLLGWNEKLNLFKKNKHLATSTNPFGLHYKDSQFTFSARPIYGYQYFTNSKGRVFHTWGGAEAYATIKVLGIYASLRDNHESQLLARPTYFTQETGGNFKENEGGRAGGDYSEMRGGITYAWKWGDVGLVKDHFEWGDNYNGSNIFSGRTPSFAHLRLHLKPAKWIEFNYVHGWLISEVKDSARSYYNWGKMRWAYRQKFLAANMITVTPFKGLNISAGNSIIYADLGGIHPAYLIPVAFYKSIDHTLNHAIDNQNSQMFIDISSRQIRNLHLFLSVFIDEFSVTRLSVKEAHNFISWKTGMHLNRLPIKDLSLTAEYTRTTPITYKHYIPVCTFESNTYNLGHYLRDNSEEIFASLNYHPVVRLHTQLALTMARHGNEYVYDRRKDIDRLPFLTDNSWKSTQVSFKTDYQFMNNAYVFAAYCYSDVKGFDLDGKTAQYYLDLFTAPFYQGISHTLSFGFNLGF